MLVRQAVSKFCEATMMFLVADCRFVPWSGNLTYIITAMVIHLWIFNFLLTHNTIYHHSITLSFEAPQPAKIIFLCQLSKRLTHQFLTPPDQALWPIQIGYLQPAHLNQRLRQLELVWGDFTMWRKALYSAGVFTAFFSASPVILSYVELCFSTV